MDFSEYRNIINSDNKLDSEKRKELLRMYLKNPSLPQLQAARALLIELKKTLNKCHASKKRCLKRIRCLLYKTRSTQNG